MVQVASWLLSVASALYTTLPSWGPIGLAVIFFPLLRKLIRLLQRIFSF